MATHQEVLNTIYTKALAAIAENNSVSSLPTSVQTQIDLLVSHSESCKGLIAVFTTLLTHKIVNPYQDIRYHQAQQPNGFAGRTVDKEYVTPFMKSVNFPSMAESGWLTRSLEQPHPYTLDYPGNITPTNVKNAFLNLINMVQTQGVCPESILVYFFIKLILQRDSAVVELAKPHSLSISKIISLLQKHFRYKYIGYGASRLPTLAVYAAYQCMFSQVARYKDKVLCPLESHNSADTRSGRIGDIEVAYSDGTAFEGVEIKHEIQITCQLINDAYEKFMTYKTNRYYLLTTANMATADWEHIDKTINKIAQIHGCQVIVNGVYSTLQYYLRLLIDPSDFIDKYVDLLKIDDSIKYQHKVAWNEIISKGL